jgi:hypothetical protein
MPDDFLRALIDPSAPLPNGWPSGALGAFCLFLIPIGGGIPLGVIMGRDAGVTPALMAAMYFVTDVFRAFTREPMLMLLRWLGRQIPFLGRIGQFFTRSTRFVGLDEEGPRGPFGIILVSFVVDPTFGRAAAGAAGHGFVSGWTLAIIGDMLFFLMLMVSTLWASSVFGDDRMAVSVVLVATFVLPLITRRLRHKPARPATPAPAAVSLGNPEADARALPRRRVSHNGRRRSTRAVRH